MKTFKYCLLLFLSVAVISCSGDDDTNTDGDNDPVTLIGVWTGSAIDVDGTFSTEFQGIPVTGDVTGEGTNIDYTITFSEDPNEVVSEGSFDLELTITILGQPTTQTVPGDQILDTGTWVKNRDEISITSGGETSVATITELTENSLILSITQEQDLSQQGTTATATITFTATFTR